MNFYGVFINTGMLSFHVSKAKAWKRVREIKYQIALDERINHRHRVKGWTKMKIDPWFVYFKVL